MVFVALSLQAISESTTCKRDTITGGGGSSIVKVSGDVPPARVYFLIFLVWPSAHFLAILVWTRVSFLAILVKMSNFRYFCIEIQNFGDFGLETIEIWLLLSRKR